MANEKRLIDANVVYEMGHRTPFHISIADLCDLKELLEDVPTVDAVEVVRCKDCKHSYDGVANLMCGRCGQNINGIRLGGVSVKAEHFCSWGERKDNG